MSTGAECIFYEENPDEWWYKLQCWPYGENPQYDTYGPFKTAKLAIKHLDQHHANPGGWSVRTHPKHVCEYKLEAERGWDGKAVEVCQKCDSPKD